MTKNNSLRNFELWAATNAKEILPAAFKELTGMTFDYFHRTFKKECIAAWNVYVEKQKQSRKFAKIAKDSNGCVCATEPMMPANATRGSDKAPMRLWRCPKHGNRCSHL
jgi:hypothetical protein